MKFNLHVVKTHVTAMITISDQTVNRDGSTGTLLFTVSKVCGIRYYHIIAADLQY